jgi:hypothetical protein
MALFTPRGLKVGVATPYAFALMARVYPRVDAFRVLQLTEEIENLSGLAAFICGLIVFGLRLPPLQIAAIVFATVAVFRLVHLLGLFVPPFTFLLPVSRIYSFVAGYGLFLAALLIFGFFTVGWRGVVTYVTARICCAVLFWFIELAWSRRSHRLTGFAFMASERSFFHAFRLAASRLGVSTDLHVPDEQLDRSQWEHVFTDLAVKWPVVVSRFTNDAQPIDGANRRPLYVPVACD